MPDKVKQLGRQELLPGKFWLVFQNERTGQITKVPEEIMTNPNTGPSMLSHMQGYGYNRPSVDPAQEDVTAANRTNMLDHWARAADTAEIAARVPQEVGSIRRGMFSDPVSQGMAEQHVQDKESGYLDTVVARERGKRSPSPDLSGSPVEALRQIRARIGIR